MTEPLIKNAEQAYRWFAGHFKPAQIDIQYPTAAYVHANGKKYFVMFKREYYRNFSAHFPHVVKEDGSAHGWGQVMNESLLKIAAHNKTDYLVFITPDAVAYRCEPSRFYSFAVEFQTHVPHLYGEVAMPLQFFERMFKEEAMR